MDLCPICGRGYLYGPDAPRHEKCRETQAQRVWMDEAVAWLLSDDPNRGPEPMLITRLRDAILDIEKGAAS